MIRLKCKVSQGGLGIMPLWSCVELSALDYLPKFGDDQVAVRR